MKESLDLPVQILGHCLITDDLGNVVLNQSNAIHPINMSRIIARILAHEDNCHIEKIAFGNGGTYYTIDENNINVIRYKSPNDGYNDNKLWESSLYYETYVKTINEKNIAISSENDYSDDNTTSKNGCVSLDKDRISQVVISCTLNNNEPKSLYPLDYDHEKLNPETVFVFDEIGLYTSGSPLKNTYGYQMVVLYNVDRYSDTSLKPNLIYDFEISVNDEDYVKIYIDTSGLSSVPYYKLIELLNDALYTSGVKVIMNDGSSLDNNLSYGNLKFESREYGNKSVINIKKLSEPSDTWLFKNLKNFIKFDRPVYGDFKWYKNKPDIPEKECNRLLTHLIFSPIIKTANRKFNIKYTLTVYVNRTYKLPIIDIIKDNNVYNELDTPELDNKEKSLNDLSNLKSNIIYERDLYILYNTFETVTPLQKTLDNIQYIKPKFDEYKALVKNTVAFNSSLNDIISSEFFELLKMDLDSRMRYSVDKLDNAKTINQMVIDELLKLKNNSDTVSKQAYNILSDISVKLSQVCILSSGYYTYNSIPSKTVYDAKILEFNNRLALIDTDMVTVSNDINSILNAPNNLKNITALVTVYDLASGISVYNKSETLPNSKDLTIFFNNVVNMDYVWGIGGCIIGSNLYRNSKYNKCKFNGILDYIDDISLIVDHNGALIPDTHVNINLSLKVDKINGNKLDIYSSGIPSKDTSGQHGIKFYKISLNKDTGLIVNSQYSLNIKLDGVLQSYIISTVGYSIVKYSDLLNILNSLGNFKVFLNSDLMLFESITKGAGSSIEIISDNASDNLLNNLYDLDGILPNVKGVSGYDYNRSGMIRNEGMLLLSLDIGNLDPSKQYLINCSLSIPKPVDIIERIEHLLPFRSKNVSNATNLKINEKYKFRLVLNDIEYGIEIITNGYDVIHFYDLIMILDKKLNHYGVNVFWKDGIIFSVLKEFNNDIKIIDGGLFGGL